MASDRARLGLGSLVLLAAIALPSLAFADPSAADKETARSLMAKGRDQIDKGDPEAALQSFKAADALMHVPTTTFAVAKMQAQLGMLVEARDTALQIARMPSGTNEPAPFVEARAKAQALSEDLETRIPAITIELKHVPVGATATVTVDGAAVPAAALGAPRKLNPGHHVVTARAASAEGKTELDVREHDTKVIEVDLLAATNADASEPSVGSGPPAPPPKDERRKIPMLAYGGFGVGVAGIVVGTVTGLVAMSKSSSVEKQCPNDKCPPSVYDSSSFQGDVSSAKTMGTISTISFIVGGAGVAVAVVALFLPSGSARASASARTMKAEPRVSPFLGVGSAGLRGSF
jgi:hypothetical protein